MEVRRATVVPARGGAATGPADRARSSRRGPISCVQALWKPGTGSFADVMPLACAAIKHHPGLSGAEPYPGQLFNHRRHSTGATGLSCGAPSCLHGQPLRRKVHTKALAAALPMPAGSAPALRTASKLGRAGSCSKALRLSDSASRRGTRIRAAGKRAQRDETVRRGVLARMQDRRSRRAAFARSAVASVGPGLSTRKPR